MRLNVIMENEGDQSEWNPHDTVRICKGSPVRRRLAEHHSQARSTIQDVTGMDKSHVAASTAFGTAYKLDQAEPRKHATMRPSPVGRSPRRPVAFVIGDAAAGETRPTLGSDTAMAHNSAGKAIETPATATIGHHSAISPSQFSLHGQSDASADRIPTRK